MFKGKANHVEPNYRDSYAQHKARLLILAQDVREELVTFQKWAEKEDGAADVARDISVDIRTTSELVNGYMRSVVESRSMGDLDELGYPSDNESTGSKPDSGMSNGTVINCKNGTADLTRISVKIENERPPASSWKGKAKEVNPPELVINTDIRPGPSMGKGKEPEIPYRFPFTRSMGESSRTRFDDSDPLLELEHDILDRYIILVDKVFEFHASWGAETKGKFFLNYISEAMQVTVNKIQGHTGPVPSTDKSPTLGSGRDTIVNRHTRTSEPRNMPSQTRGEGTNCEADSSERKPFQYKIIIPARTPKQLPPREMRKRQKLLDSFQVDSNVDDELEGKIKEEEISPQLESISQAFRPIERRTRYNLRSNARKKNVAGPSHTTDEPVQAEQKGKKKQVLKPEASKRANRKRHAEDEGDGSHRNKKRRREDEIKKREIKKESLNKRKRDEGNVNEETNTRKRTRRN